MADYQSVFKVVLSTKHEIPLDPSEVSAVMRSIEKGAVIRVKQGIINPSYLVAIVEDKERAQSWFEDQKYDPVARGEGIKPLKDIFREQTPQLNQPRSAEGQVQ